MRGKGVGGMRVSESTHGASGWEPCGSRRARPGRVGGRNAGVRAFESARTGGGGEEAKAAAGERARLEGQEYVLVYEAGETDVPCIIERSPGLWSPAAAAIHLQAMLA